MKKRKTPLWLGYLEAGKSASPVVRDSSLDTGNPATIYLFNLMRGRILEYRKDIVELKLRELSPEESSMANALQAAFQTARDGFTPRGGHRSMSPPTRRRTRRGESEIPEIPDFGDDDAWPPDEDGPSSYSAELSD